MRDISIISGYSGVGKSTAAKQFQHCIDLESSDFSKDKHEWPYNYVDRVEDLIEAGKADCIMVSCHREVRDEMTARGIPYIVVCPTEDQKNDYIRRWFCRGSEINFIRKMSREWSSMLDSCMHGDAPYISLSKGEFISNLLEKTNGIAEIF